MLAARCQLAGGGGPPSRGFVYRLSDDRILERLETGDTFTDVFGYGETADRQLALLSFEEDVISALAVMVRGQAVASYKRVIRFSAVTHLEPPLEIGALLDQMSESQARLLRSTFENGGALAPERFVGVLKALEQARPELAPVIAELASLLGAAGSPACLGARIKLASESVWTHHGRADRRHRRLTSLAYRTPLPSNSLIRRHLRHQFPAEITAKSAQLRR
jgi:hypothetical protein